MRKVVVIGNNGTGKSVSAVKLGKKLNLPVIHLDTYFHKPGWTKVSNEEWDKIHGEFIKGKEWIMDGTYKRTLDKRINAADTVIFLDFPKWLAFYRMVRRRILNRNSRRPDMPEFLTERLSMILLRKNLTFSKKRIYQILQKYNDTKVIIILKNNKEVDRFLKEV